MAVDLIFHATFIASKAGKTGLTVTVDVDKIQRSDGARTAVVTGASATEGRNGHYWYRSAGVADLQNYDYIACFKTTDTSVDQQHLHAAWFPFPLAYAAELAYLDAAITSRLASVGYTTPPTAAQVRDAILTDATRFAGANIDAAISSRQPSGNVTVGALAAAALRQFFQTDTGLGYSDAVDGSVLKETLDGVPPSSVGAAAIWAYVTRTLTQSAASIAAAVSGSTITIQRGDTLSVPLTGIGALTGYVSLDFTVKTNPIVDADAAAIVRIRKNASGLSDGLLVLNGATGTAAQGSITITSEPLGNITIALAAEATAQLGIASGLYYDVQMITASGIVTRTEGICNIASDVTRAIV